MGAEGLGSRLQPPSSPPGNMGLFLRMAVVKSCDVEQAEPLTKGEAGSATCPLSDHKTTPGSLDTPPYGQWYLRSD